jgi:hypothetical protein
MEKRPVGRPKKLNAVKSGQLKEGECRFTFITSDKIVKDIRRGAVEEKLKIREYLNKVLEYYWDKNRHRNNKEILTKDETFTKDEILLLKFQKRID